VQGGIRRFLSGGFIKIILQDVEKVVWEAVGAVAFTVFLYLGKHAAEGVSIDGFFAGHFLLQLAEPV